MAIPRFDLPDAPVADSEKPEKTSDADPKKSGPQIIEFPTELAPLKQNAWVPLISAQKEPPKAGFRWIHAGMEELWRLPAGSRPDLSLAIRSSDKVTTTNAAILQARWGEGDPTGVLTGTVRQSSLPMTLRCAAADALSLVRTPAALSALQSLTDELGDLSPDYRTRYVPQMHATLLQALAAHVAAMDDERFKAALKSPAAEVRLEALRAWAQCKVEAASAAKLPDQLLALREDDDPRLRALTLETLVAFGHPQAQEFVSQALKDYEFSVRTAAISALGSLADDASLQALEKLREHPAELTRAAVVRALAVARVADKVSTAAADKSWLVRKVVAESLAQLATDEPSWSQHIQLAEQLLADASIQVQDAALQSVSAWPVERAGPVLLKALEVGGYKTRKSAAELLTQLWPPAESFPVNGAKDRRAEILATLVQKWNEEHPRTAIATVVRATAGAAVRPETIRQVEDLLVAVSNPDAAEEDRRQAVGVLKSLGGELLTALESRAADAPLPPVIYRDVLPALNPLFESLDRLGAKQLTDRRAAAAAIVQYCAREQLSPLALSRLLEVMTAERDAVIWQYALTATFEDPRDPAVELAYLAIGHDSPEVRRRACEYLRAHPGSQHAAVVIPALNDTSGEVVIAAVRALGAAGTLEDHHPLTQLLLTSDKHLRLEVAASLARLKDPAGPAALERLSHEVDADLRRRVAVVTGELADPVFVPALIPLLSDRPEIQRAALISLKQIVGRDVARSEEGTTLSPAEQSRRWEQWYRDTQADRKQ